MKFTKVFAVLSAVLLIAAFVCGCAPSTKPEEDAFDYDALYANKTNKPYEDTDMLNYTKASFGYVGTTEQGYNGWYYGTLADDKSVIASDDVTFDGENIVLTKGHTAVRRYVYNGVTVQATVCGRLRLSDDKGRTTTLAVYVNDDVAGSCCAVDGGDTRGIYFEYVVDLQKGDRLDFRFTSEGATVQCDPIVYFGGDTDETLYRLTSFGKYYGDVFPWYDEENGKLYMGFIWTDDARNNDYKDALEVADNMLTFIEVPEANNYDIWQRYKQGGRLHHLFDANKVVDRNEYPFGVRDNMVYRDEKNNRMLVIAGVYRRFDAAAQTSDLAIYASDDIHGLSWTKPRTIVAAGYDRNLPECPTLMKIGNRWYVFVSVAYNTAHQVGPLQYWTGDADVDCMDVDWQSKSFSFVDGEDLCAARPIKVGNKVYMWGWIPRTYDTMPWAPWGGYLNLPREVVARQDGSLGGRMDKGLQRMLDYGKVFVANKDNLVGDGSEVWMNNAVSVSDSKLFAVGDYCRNMVRFRLQIDGATEAGAELLQNGKRYCVSVVKEGDEAYMQVSSPDDAKHKINSRIAVSNDGVYDVMFTVDNGIIEFFVNDNYALTAHTAMSDGAFSLGLYSVGKSTFEQISVSKLAPYQSL